VSSSSSFGYIQFVKMFCVSVDCKMLHAVATQAQRTLSIRFHCVGSYDLFSIL